jgi:hypothetical protein
VEADINGPQRKVISTTIRPVRAAHGTSGIAVRDGKTLPFEVTRAWSAPAGYYPEQWFLVDPATKEVLYERPARVELVKGLQAITEFTDRLEEPFDLAVGTYQIVFSLGRLKGGEVEIVVAEAPAEDTAA